MHKDLSIQFWTQTNQSVKPSINVSQTSNAKEEEVQIRVLLRCIKIKMKNKSYPLLQA